MPNGRTLRRTVASAVTLLALAAGATALSGSVAHGQSQTAQSAGCTAWYVVTSPAAEVWIDPEPTGWYELWDTWARGKVFCALGSNASGTRYRVEHWCDLRVQYCDPIGPITGWVTSSSASVAPLNCAPQMLTRQAYVFKEAAESPSTARWTIWNAGQTFCTFGKNASGGRYKVYHHCDLDDGCATAQVVIGWVSTDPRYYTPIPPPPTFVPPSPTPRPSSSCRPWLPCDLPSASAAPQ